jgi:hypothetical protein
MKSINGFKIEETEQYIVNEGSGILELRCLNGSDYFIFARNRVLGCSFKDCVSVHNGNNSVVEKFDFVGARVSFMLRD